MKTASIVCVGSAYTNVDPREVKLDSMLGNAATNIVDLSDKKSS